MCLSQSEPDFICIAGIFCVAIKPTLACSGLILMAYPWPLLIPSRRRFFPGYVLRSTDYFPIFFPIYTTLPNGQGLSFDCDDHRRSQPQMERCKMQNAKCKTHSISIFKTANEGSIIEGDGHT